MPEQIRELNELREAGALTVEEFSAKKEELLDGM
ncbi:MAG: SHOCT domain-containing protein [Chloroflexi bacterium]|nr:SHOCT domain-containing protein [Chloroflexota bacterium]